MQKPADTGSSTTTNYNRPNTESTDRFLSVKECAVLLSCHPATIWRMSKTEQFPNPIRIGHLTRWSEMEIQLYLARLRAAGA